MSLLKENKTKDSSNYEKLNDNEPPNMGTMRKTFAGDRIYNEEKLEKHFYDTKAKAPALK